ncbi:hypothetical protein [Desulfosporosinus sp. OT]|uniref:hypothetical protein n=1 Tax=Desulfosporosinus sp. OT TaxID=913865 RepID=UPI0002239C13|nr:hypothetical protein [Desulfosporosinus sp. OT]EGW36032.1 hypothetical protein DOT_6089 [Desulfosporosinus sp. OT]
MMTDQNFWQWVWRKNSIIKKYGSAGPPLVLRYVTAQQVLYFWQSLTFKLNMALPAFASYATAGASSARYAYETVGAPPARNAYATAGVPPARNAYATAGVPLARYAYATVGAPPARYAYATVGATSARYGKEGLASASIRAGVTLPEAAAFFREYPCAVTVIKERQGLKAPAGSPHLGDAAIKRAKLFPLSDIERYAWQSTQQTLAIWHNKAVGQVKFSQGSIAASQSTTRVIRSPVNKLPVKITDSQWRPVLVGVPIKVVSPMTIKASVTTMPTATAIESSVAVMQTPNTAGYATEAIRYAWVVAGVAQNSATHSPRSVNCQLKSRGKGPLAEVHLKNTPGYRSRSDLVSHTSAVHAHALDYTTAVDNTPPSVEIIHAAATSVHEPVEIIHVPATTTYKPATTVQAPDSTVRGITIPSTASAVDISRLAEQVYRVIEGKIIREKERRGM